MLGKCSYIDKSDFFTDSSYVVCACFVSHALFVAIFYRLAQLKWRALDFTILNALFWDLGKECFEAVAVLQQSS